MALFNKENRLLNINEGFTSKKNTEADQKNNLYNAVQTIEQNSDNLNQPTREYLNSILNEGQGPKAFNPFINSKGNLVNPYADYQKVLNNDAVSSRVKSWISDATGLTQTNASNTAATGNAASSATNTSGTSSTSGTNNELKFNGGYSSSQLASLDIKSELPKLSTAQISTIIDKYFGKSPVISSSDAKGIYDAQQSTGMSALAILGIGALESGYGTSAIAKAKNNLWGYGAVNSNPMGGATSFSPIAQGATQFAQKFMNTYYDKYGAKSISQTGTGNNPAGKGYAYNNDGTINASWADKVGNIMGQFYDTAKTVSIPSATSKSVSATGSGKGSSMVNIAKQYLGTPYVWGGTSTKGFDCSGLMQYVAKQMGVNLSRTTYTQIKEGTAVDKNYLQPGDLVFFGTSNNPHHVGMYVGNGQYLHAPKTGDVVKISNLADRKDFLTARRIVQ